MEMKYPHHPGFKRGSIDTSEDVAALIAPTASIVRDRVAAAYRWAKNHAFIHDGGLTADECAAQLDISILTVRPRCSELIKMGKLRDTGMRRTNATSGKSAAVLAWVEPGEAEQLSFFG